MAIIILIRGYTLLVGILLGAYLAYHFRWIKWVCDIQLSSTFRTTLSRCIISRNWIAHCCLSSKLAAEFSDKDVLLTHLYENPMSSLNTLWIVHNFAVMPVDSNNAIWTCFEFQMFSLFEFIFSTIFAMACRWAHMASHSASISRRYSFYLLHLDTYADTSDGLILNSFAISDCFSYFTITACIMLHISRIDSLFPILRLLNILGVSATTSKPADWLCALEEKYPLFIFWDRVVTAFTSRSTLA
jgi:hypothetical protein